jgi:hypothetical protein
LPDSRTTPHLQSGNAIRCDDFPRSIFEITIALTIDDPFLSIIDPLPAAAGPQVRRLKTWIVDGRVEEVCLGYDAETQYANENHETNYFSGHNIPPNRIVVTK